MEFIALIIYGGVCFAAGFLVAAHNAKQAAEVESATNKIKL